jgi:hypothetical protein
MPLKTTALEIQAHRRAVLEEGRPCGCVGEEALRFTLRALLRRGTVGLTAYQMEADREARLLLQNLDDAERRENGSR